jgi:hypothetical protein
MFLTSSDTNPQLFLRPVGLERVLCQLSRLIILFLDLLLGGHIHVLLSFLRAECWDSDPGSKFYRANRLVQGPSHILTRQSLRGTSTADGTDDE